MPKPNLTLKQSLQNILDKLPGDNGDTIWPLLPLLRRKEHETELNALIEEVVQTDKQPDLYNGKCPLKVISWHLADDDQPYIQNYEPDRVIFKREHQYQNVDELIQDISLIMVSDCTHCCNALEYVNLSKHGIIAYGDVSMTYHS